MSLDESKIDVFNSNTNKFQLCQQRMEIRHLRKKISFNYFFNINLLNKCKEYEKNDNVFFCKTCHKNICQNCFQICYEKNYTLKNLKEEKIIYEKQKELIKRILIEYSTKFHKKENNSKEKNREKFVNIDIIKKIIQKDYLNHFQNIIKKLRLCQG